MTFARALVVLVALWPMATASAQDGDLSAIAERVRTHDDEAALALLAAHPERDSARLRYLRGRLLERQGRFAEAADAYPTGQDAAALPDEPRADARRRAAGALARAGRCAEAEPLWAPDASDPLVEARLAECALARGELDVAIDRLEAVSRRRADEVDLFAARLLLAEALSAAERPDEAVDVLTRLVVERPEHPEASLASRRLRALAGDDFELSFSQRMRRVERLVEVRRFADALEVLSHVERPRTRGALRHWLHVRGMALYRERHHYAEAAEVLAESAQAGGAYAVVDEFHAARARSRAGDDRGAIRAYRAFARAHADHPRAAEATYLAAWLELRIGARGGERAMRRFARSGMARRAPALARAANWQLGLRAFEAERYREAARRFDDYASSGTETLVRARGLYWLGRARAARGDRTGAVDAYGRALGVEPLHYYAALSRQRLEELGEPAPPVFPEPALDEAAPEVEPALPREARFYASLGLHREARDALRSRERALRRAHGLPSIVAAYRELGEANRLVRMLGGASTLRRRAAPGPADRWRWDAAYPRPWPEAVRAAASAVGLTEAHLYAVMRQESGFNPDVVSYADAIGLMQLLPSTAGRVARRLGLNVRREQLFDPAINARLGAAYVSELVERFGLPLAFAGFNAGGHRVAEWLEATGEIALDLFVERIPFEQTRNYVRRVTSHWLHYRYLEDPAGGWPLTLPTVVEPR